MQSILQQQQQQQHPQLQQQQQQRGRSTISRIYLVSIGFLLGCLVSGSVILHFLASNQHQLGGRTTSSSLSSSSFSHAFYHRSKNGEVVVDPHAIVQSTRTLVKDNKSSMPSKPLQDVRILIAIAAFDFSQLPHLEEVLDSYQDLCVSGASKVDVIIHATIPYPVTLIDMFNSRLVPSCQDIYSVTISLQPSSLRLHLVDIHRPLFYQKLTEYDLFIYTEDDIRVPPHAVAAYLSETQTIETLVGAEKASNFNVGIVRYEYNYPSNVVIDDKTRHATQNVTRVYWEHGRWPIVPKAVDQVKREDISTPEHSYVHMTNHHQGMFMATQDLLKAWKDRSGCKFHEVRNRPGMKNKPSQPAEGTQRVWMSSQMLYGKSHCNVQQVIPAGSFGTLTVLHLPNKNYRRVGHFRNRTFSDGTEKFDSGPTGALLTAMALHLELRDKFPPLPQHPYRGIQMVDEVGPRGRTPLLERRLKEYKAYVDRGGILSEDDRMKVHLVEEM